MTNMQLRPYNSQKVLADTNVKKNKSSIQSSNIGSYDGLPREWRTNVLKLKG